MRRSRRHAVERYLDVLRERGIDVRGAEPRDVLRDEEIKSARTLLRERGVDPEGMIVGIHPGGGWPYKLWGAEGFARLAEMFAAELGARVLLFCGPGEEELAERVESLSSAGVIRFEGLPLRTVAALISLCSLYVGNDTGTTHLAAAVGTPTVAIFGPTDHIRSGPYGEHTALVLPRLRLKCMPCHPWGKPGGCGEGVCPALKSITSRDVFGVCTGLLRRMQKLA
ncbi:hypothetical protein DRP77_09930 [Candidatus Poribacteria bacterium]|nr:MAG: hypothetical protein DRP77_09930 [Candidatus Poribacteria bacterium]